MSSDHHDEVESAVLGELREYETERDSQPDPHLDSNYESDLEAGSESEGEIDSVAWEKTMSYPSCGLCRFEFEVGEEFVVYSPVSQLYPRIWYGQYELGYKDSLVVEKGFHPCCVKLLKPKTLVKNWPFNLSDVTSGRQHYLIPPASWTKRRTRWIKESIASDLRQAISGRLPEEICQYIASFCMRERACLILRGLWLDPARPKSWIKQLTIGRNNSIWAQNVEVEGLRYVRSLSTRRLTEQDTLIFKARYRKRSASNRPEACLNIYYSEDHGGIRQVIVTEDRELPSLKMEPGLSWTVSRQQETPLQFVLRYDDIKLRFLTTSESQERDTRHEQRPWGVLPDRFDSFPQIPLATCGHPGDRLHYESVRAVDWNSPGTCGYSFYVDRNVIRGIVSHKFGEPEPKKRDEYGPIDDLWFHMPIDPDERVSELWLRRGMDIHVGNGEIETLIVRTTKGRSFTPGLSTACGVPIDDTLKFTYKAIAIFPSEGASRMFYCRAKWLWTYFAFEQPAGLSNEGGLQGVVSWDQNEIQHSFPPSDNPLVSLFSFVETSASLSDVRTITPCRGWSSELSHEVVGLVLTYGDGRRRCIGQVRLDCLDPPLQVYSNNFWLGLVDLEGVEPGEYHPWHLRVISFHLSEPEPDDDTRYIKIPFSGRLDWAVLGFASAVRHVEEGEGGPCDEIGQAMAGRKSVLEYASPEIKTFAVPIRVMEAGL